MTVTTPPIKLVIGLESHMLPQEELEEVQLVTADGEHFALIEQYPLWENAEFIVKAVNSHDALVVALEDAVTWLHLASQNQGTSPLITKRHQVEAAKIETVLEQVKE